MRTFAITSGMTALLLLTVPASYSGTPPAQKGGSGTIVIVFKDGHKQSFNLADIEKVEFPGSAFISGESKLANPEAPPRGHYVGKWEVGDGNGSDFTITLSENGDAMRSLGDVHGHWTYVNGEARVTWDDGAQDAIRKVGTRYQKFAYRQGKAFTDTPDNVTSARLTNPRPV